ncbi:hypothetical protein C8Q70DRAFT_1049293 [Cubamyces menziesii]|nr:hypothetical protein C8Q70DRAFT_1049293 [Cubamyces menziesii]
MSTWPQAVQASAVYWASSVRLNNNLSLMALTILYYDYLLTLFSEIEHFWKSANISLVSVLFVVNRYLGILGPIPIAVEYYSDMPEHAATVTSISPAKTKTPLPFTFTGCDLSLTNTQGIHLSLAWGAMLWFDTTIFLLTLIRALRMRSHLPGGLLHIMFRDGTIYYGIMVASNVSNIITFMVTRSGSPLKGTNTTLTNVLSTTLTSRLILNLRSPDLQRSRRIDHANPSNAWNAASALAVSGSTAFDCTLTDVIMLGVETEASAIDTV